MKKILLASSFALCLATQDIKAQGQGSGSGSSSANAQWKTNGNTGQTTDFIGTTNSSDLIFKTNNTTRGRIDAGGNLNWDGGGKLRVGPIISNPIPNLMFELNGSGVVTGEFSGNRAVFVKALIQDLRPDTIHMDTNKVVAGDTRILGNLIVKNDASIGGDLKISGTITGTNGVFSGSLASNSFSTNTLDLAQYLSFNGGTAKIGFTQTSQGGVNWNILRFGPQFTPQNLACTTPPSPVGTGTPWNNVFASRIQLYNTDGPGGPNTPNNVLTIQSDTYGASIDLAGNSTNTGNPNDAIAINYYCGKDVLICNNAANTGGANGKGGVIRMGQNVEIGGPIIDYNTALNVRANGTTIFKLTDLTYAERLNVGSDGRTLISVNGPTTKAFAIRDYAGGTGTCSNEMFKIYGSGQTFIGGGLTGGAYVNAMLQVNGQIASKEVHVLAGPWCDFVFEEKYKLRSIYELEAFYKQFKHLPDIPSEKEVSENGIDLATMDAALLKRVEESTLYIVQLKKEMDQLKMEMEKLQKQNDDLAKRIKSSNKK